MKFVAKCLNCKQVKDEHQRPRGLTQYIPIPSCKWEDINLDFVVGFPCTGRQNYSIWVIVDRLKKSANFIQSKLLIQRRNTLTFILRRF